MAGKECVAIGSDLRLGVQFQTLATDHKKVFRIHDKLYVGLAGLSTDAQTLCALRLASAAICTDESRIFMCSLTSQLRKLQTRSTRCSDTDWVTIQYQLFRAWRLCRCPSP